MTQFSPQLNEKLARLSNSCVRYDEVRKCYVNVVTGHPQRGLTKLLGQLVPVPYDKLDTEELAEAEARTLKPRRSRNDPAAEPVIERFAGSAMRRCADCKAAHQWLLERGPSSRIRERLREEPNLDKAHGMVVDYQMQLYVRAGSREKLFEQCGVIDPCVGTLLEYFDARGWAVVATQMPLFAAEMLVATAFDLVVTDKATRSKLILVEIKSTRGAVGEAQIARNNMHYERLRGRLKRSALRGIPLSHYSRHQLQLFCMQEMVRSEHKFTFDDAVIVRVSPGTTRTYTLNQYYLERAKAIVRAICLKTGKIGGKKRKRA